MLASYEGTGCYDRPPGGARWARAIDAHRPRAGGASATIGEHGLRLREPRRKFAGFHDEALAVDHHAVEASIVERPEHRTQLRGKDADLRRNLRREAGQVVGDVDVHEAKG